MRRRRAPRLVAAGLAAALTAACGSTVPQGALGPAAGGTDGLAATELDALPGDAASTAGAAGGSSTGNGGGAPSAALQQGATSTGATSAGGTQQTGTGAGSGAAPTPAGDSGSVVGLTDTTITLGFEYTENADSANQAAGFGSITKGDGKRMLEIMIDEINRTGGIAGRRVAPVFHVYDGTSPASTASQEQAACATFTEDHKVFAVLSLGIHDDAYVGCLQDRGVLFVNAPLLTASDDTALSRFRLKIELNSLSLSAQGELYGEPMAGTGYYDKGAKIGLVTYCESSFQRTVAKHVKPALKRVGQSLTDEACVAFPQSQSEISNLTAAIGNAVLQMRSSGVTHMLLLDLNATLTAFFAIAASNQSYYPRYGWLSQNGGQAASELIPDKRSLRGAVQLGWLPSIDLSAAQETIRPPFAKTCEDLFKSKGYVPASRNEQGILQGLCDLFFLTRDAARRVPQLTQPALVDAFRAVTHPPAGPYRLDLRTRRSGAAGYRVQRWDEPCACFKAEGPVRPVS